MEAIGLGGADNAGRRLTVLRAIDKLDRLGIAVCGRFWAADARTRAATSRGARSWTSTRLQTSCSRSRCDISHRTIPPDGRPGTSGFGFRVDRISTESSVVWHLECRRSAKTMGACQFESEPTIDLLRAWLSPTEGIGNGLESWRKSAAWSEQRRLRSRSHSIRPFRRARARILHRPRFRSRAHLRDARRGRQADPLRLGRRRRALRRARRALPRRTGPGDRLLDRRLAAARGAARDQKPDRRFRRSARSGRGADARPRPGLDGELPAPRRALARGRNRGRTLSRPGRHERAAQIRRQALEPLSRSSRARTSATRRAARR